jgi:hypothetical protein
MITKVVIYLAILAVPSFALSQRPEGSSTKSSPSSSQLPDAPVPRSGRIPEMSDWRGDPSSAEQEPDALPQTKRILGVVPNFRSVDADTRLRPQTVKEKFSTGLQDSFDYSSFIFVAAQAGAAQATNGYPAFRQGTAGFGRYYWHTFADQADENLWVESFIPSVLHEDDRYYTLGHGGVFKRARYALSRAFVTRNDGGNVTVNAGEIAGAGIAAGISSAYYPGEYRTWTKTGQRWLTNIVLDDATFGLKEFWPDINQRVFHGRH